MQAVTSHEEQRRQQQDWLPSSIRDEIRDVTQRSHVTVLELWNGDEEERLSLDHRTVNHVVSFLQRTPRVNEISIACNFETNDALDAFASLLQSTQHIETVSIMGDCNVDTNKSREIDDGTALQCVSKALASGKSISIEEVECEYYDFSRPNCPLLCQSFRQLLVNKTPLRKLSLDFCVFGSNNDFVAFLVEGLAAQQETLEELYMMHTTFADMDEREQQMNAILTTLATGQWRRLRHLSLCAWNIDSEKVTQSLCRLLARGDCQLQHLDVLGNHELLTKPVLKDVLVETLACRNLSLHTMEREQATVSIFASFLRRNQLVSKVRQSERNHGFPLGLWALAIGRFVAKERMHGKGIAPTPIYAALVSLSSKLAGKTL